MPIILVRIDDRLIHGQVVQGWLKAIDVDIVLIASDVVAQDEIQQLLMAMTMPSDVELVIENLKDATSKVVNGQYGEKKMMILTASPSDVLYMLDNGVDFKSVNVGGMHFKNGKKQLLYNLYVDVIDLEDLYMICRKGVEIEGRIFPKDEKSNIMHLVEKEYLAIHKKME